VRPSAPSSPTPGGVPRDHGEFTELPGTDDDAADEQLEEILQRVSGVGLTRLTPEESAALLGHYGIRLLPSAAFDSADGAVKAADRLGWPVALKTTDEYLRHRLDLGGVRLGIEDADSLRANILQMEKALAPFGSFGMEVQRMAPPARRAPSGRSRIRCWGPCCPSASPGTPSTCSTTGATACPPLTSVDVADLVRAPRASRKLFGYQGLPPADIAAVEDLVARVALLKDNHPEIALLEFNPVLVSTSGLAILSAVIDVGNPRQRTDSARRAMRD
jgi:acyl-CoA synthetase (NDP forming)